ncbi:MAG: hypothetical protein P8X55_10235 [Desulfosarcinaceae bacterium]
MTKAVIILMTSFLLSLPLSGCGGGSSDSGDSSTGTSYEDVHYTEITDDMPQPGNPDGGYPVPSEAMEEDTSAPDRVIGDGTPESCTSAAVVEAVALGGVITFDCGPDPLTITMQETAKVFNDTGPEIVIDGGGLVTLSGAGRRRILYMNTCAFIDANSKDETEYDGGGAIWVRGGRFKVINCRFFNNVCADTGPDVGGGAIRAFSQYHGNPIFVAHSTFGGRADLGNVGSNGGAISSIGVSWTILNSLFTHNRAIGNGGNPAESGTPGGGSGGAIYNDGNTMTLSVWGTRIEENEVNAYGSAIFFVSNNHDGTLNIQQSIIRNNINYSNHPWEILPGISGHLDTTLIVDDDSIIE